MRMWSNQGHYRNRLIKRSHFWRFDLWCTLTEGHGFHTFLFTITLLCEVRAAVVKAAFKDVWCGLAHRGWFPQFYTTQKQKQRKTIIQVRDVHSLGQSGILVTNAAVEVLWTPQWFGCIATVRGGGLETSCSSLSPQCDIIYLPYLIPQHCFKLMLFFQQNVQVKQASSSYYVDKHHVTRMYVRVNVQQHSELCYLLHPALTASPVRAVTGGSLSDDHIAPHCGHFQNAH